MLLWVLLGLSALPMAAVTSFCGQDLASISRVGIATRAKGGGWDTSQYSISTKREETSSLLSDYDIPGGKRPFYGATVWKSEVVFMDGFETALE
jgi:hypothetical protein